MMIKGLTRCLALAGTITLAAPAWAHSLTDHRLITNHAITEFNFCFDRLISAGLSDDLQEHVRDEDTNLVRKWSLYSHFYNPNKELTDLSRLDSSMRLALLQKEITDGLKTSTVDDWGDAFDELGHAIHHIQDMTSPPHVVPVMHGLFDGFEGYEISNMDYPDLRLDETFCQRLLKNRKPMGIYQVLKETALQTLASLDGELVITRNGEAARVTWKDWYWRESTQNTFGDYGTLGNHFGTTQIKYGNLLRVNVARSTFLEFKRARLRDAIDRTVEALVWFFFHN